MKIIMTRHAPVPQHDLKEYGEQHSPPANDFERKSRTGRAHVPIGCELEPPHPDAEIKFIAHEKLWFFVYWVVSDDYEPQNLDEAMTQARRRGYPG